MLWTDIPIQPANPPKPIMGTVEINVAPYDSQGSYYYLMFDRK